MVEALLREVAKYSRKVVLRQKQVTWKYKEKKKKKKKTNSYYQLFAKYDQIDCKCGEEVKAVVIEPPVAVVDVKPEPE